MEKTLGQRIAEMRKAKGLTQEYLAEKMGVSSQAVSKWENDLSCPDIMSLPLLAQQLDVSTDALLSGEKTPEVRLVPTECRKSIDEMMLRILVNSRDSQKVRINIPMSLIRVLLESGASPSSLVDSDVVNDVDFEQILRLVESGVIGKLMEIEVDGTTVDILVE